MAEADGAEHFLGTVHNQFRPDTDQEEVVPPGNWPQLAPVLAEEEESDTFSWLDLDPKGTADYRRYVHQHYSRKIFQLLPVYLKLVLLENESVDFLLNTKVSICVCI